MSHFSHSLWAAVHHNRLLFCRATEVERPPSLADCSEHRPRWSRPCRHYINTMPPVVSPNRWWDPGGTLIVFCEWNNSMKAAQDIVMKMENLSNGSLSGSSCETGRGRLIAKDGKVGLSWSAWKSRRSWTTTHITQCLQITNIALLGPDELFKLRSPLPSPLFCCIVRDRSLTLN